MNLSLSNTKIGPKQFNSHYLDDRVRHSLHKIPPLLIFRENLLNSCRLRRRIQIDSHKYIAKLLASGPETSRILQGIERLRCVKWIKKFEFDPYLCDRSHINDLSKICHKIRDITKLNLVIRRVDFPHEIGTLAPLIARFLRLRSIRVELPRTKNTHEDGFIQLYKAMRNCSYLRFFEWKATEMPERSERLARVSEKLAHCLKWLEGVKFYETVKKGTLKSDTGPPKRPPKIRRRFIKYLDITFSSAREWANKEMMNEKDKDQDQEIQSLTGVAKLFHGLERMSLHLIKTIPTFEDVGIFFTMVSLVPTICHLEYEFINSQISDIQVIAVAHGLTKAKQLKYFSFKVIQKPGISEDCIEKLASVVSKLDNLAKFDVYFRRLDIHPRAIKDLGNRIENLGNIECSCSKESIYFFRKR